ncbi:MAG: hypothetical protein HY519_03440, partial [Candidatus Aenigmarchaeota archaeon]|nr:hypothetical protein [Candidatus Aenigmarchaeota archaeon]
LLHIYWQNHSKLKSRYTIGLMVFVGLFLLHSLIGLYFDAAMVMYSTQEAANAALLLETLKAVAFAVLLKTSFE